MKFFVLLFLSLFTSSAWAHPVSYKDGFAVMTWNQPDLTDVWAVYTLHPKVAIAARYMRMRQDKGDSQAYLPQLNLLLKRWSETDSQANIYVYGGYGFHEHLDSRGDMWLGGVEADWETRSLFVLAKAESMRATHGQNLDLYEARFGFAPYEADFKELASWLMIQYQHHWTLKNNQSLTPLVRFFYRSVLWEGGVSLDGDAMMNFMFHF